MQAMECFKQREWDWQKLKSAAELGTFNALNFVLVGASRVRMENEAGEVGKGSLTQSQADRYKVVDAVSECF